MKNIVLYLFLSLITLSVEAQEETIGDNEILFNAADLSDESDASYVAEQLAILSDNPVKVNSGSEDEISRLFFLTEFQVKVLTDHIARHGPIASVYEIALLPGFDRSTAMMVSPYISLIAGLPGDTLHHGTTVLTAAAMARITTTDSPQVRYLMKCRHSSDRLSFGFTGENDPGEVFTFRNSYGPDFLSGYAMHVSAGVLSRVIVGDYSLRFGEGLIMNNNSWHGSRLLSPSFMTGRIVVAPYSSTEENNFFRGVACVIGRMTTGAVIFISSNMIDGRVGYNTKDGSAYVTNLVKTGLHTGVSGEEMHDRLRENVAGIHLSAGWRQMRGGVSALMTSFSIPLQPDSTDKYSFPDFRGDRLLNLSADIKGGTGRILFFSEVACSSPGSFAALAGARAAPSARVTFNITGRYYDPRYYAFHSGAYRTGASVSNESGLGLNIQLEAAKHFFIRAGADICRYPWLRYRSTGPGSSLRLAITGEYSPARSLQTGAAFVSVTRDYDISDQTGMALSTQFRKDQINLWLTYSPAECLRLITRAMYCSVDKEEKGYLLSQDMLIQPGSLPLRIWMRYTLFSTDGYDSRLYSWENDMLQCFSLPGLSGEGSRAYVMISWKPFHDTEVRAKYALTETRDYQKRDTTRDVRVQCRISF